ncbi:MAG TPA: PaaI family thioesterase [Gemmatimonadales bacterium]|nr:PaaI family thioesterase [Gemmatimonadales bacterium]
MTDAEHHRKLERLYTAAPVSQWYGATIAIADGQAEVRLAIRPEFYHAAHAVHGSVYFRALDDAAFFAVNSRVRDVLVLTVSFTVHFARPVTSGEMRAVGRLLHGSGRLFLAEADLFDNVGKLLGRGSGVFTRSAIPLDPSIGYT